MTVFAIVLLLVAVVDAVRDIANSNLRGWQRLLAVIIDMAFAVYIILELKAKRG